MDAEDKRAKMLARLENRHGKRQELKDQAPGLSGRDATAVLFEEQFTSAASQIEQLFTDLDSSTDRNTSLQTIGEKIMDVEKLLTAYIHDLPLYDARKAQNSIQDLRAKHLELKQQQKPRGAFSFAKRKPAAAQNECQKVADEKSEKTAPIKAPETAPKKQFDFLSSESDKRHAATYSDRNDETIRIIDAVNQDVQLQRLNNCTVYLQCAADTVHLSDINTCTIIARPVHTTVFVENAHNCTLTIACQQLRAHSSTDCRFYLHVTGAGIIEDCKEIKVAPYPINSADENRIEEYFKQAELDVRKNNWERIQDFNWLAAATPSPNWAVMNEKDRAPPERIE